MCAKKFILKDKVVTTGDIATMKNRSYSTISNWLRDVPNMTDVTGIVERHDSTINGKQAYVRDSRTWIFHNKEMSAIKIGRIVSAGTPTVREWLKDVSPGTVVDDIIDLRCSSKKHTKLYLYDGKLCTKAVVADTAKCSVSLICGIIDSNDVCEKDDITHLVNETIAKRSRPNSHVKFVYRGKLQDMTSIAGESGLGRKTVSKLLRTSKKGSTVDETIDTFVSSKCRRFIYRDKSLTIKEISAISGRSKSAITVRLRDVLVFTDVTNIVDAIDAGKRVFIFLGKSCSVAEIATALSVSVGVVRKALIGVESGTDVTALINSKTFYRRDAANIDGMQLSKHQLAIFLNITNAVPNMMSEEYLVDKNYSERLKLGFDKSSRSTWIIDDLWDYECPVCGKHLLLTTDEIITHEHGEICEEAEI